MKFYRLTEKISKISTLEPGTVVVYSQLHKRLYKVATPTEAGAILWGQYNLPPADKVEPLTQSELRGLSPHISKSVYSEYLSSVGIRHGSE